ncbi:MBL fold metallo-hydrolase [Nocardia sp. CC227C]|uniref:MBL fold metallo-hydrolase n=1 Tax=Nocardia sp. CC227C TaxID=3044562 RepID=UPI00278C694E|nr:MBL fold metallo-hydrolase [Nocardia sp. CC227C]
MTDQVPPVGLAELAEGVHAYIQLPGGWCMSNAGVITGGDGALVVDTLATESRARRLRAAVDAVAPGKLRTIVNTHHHGDHIFGNHVFGPTATIIAHENALREITKTGLALTGMWPDVDWGDVRITPPSLTFTDRLTVRLGRRTAELIHLGPAHTTNDVVVWLAEERIMFAGDLVMSGATPFMLMGSVAGSLTALGRLREFGARQLVCGHGPVTGPEVIDETVEYLEWIQGLAANGVRRGLTPLELAHEAGDGGFGHLIDGERIVGNLHRAYAELESGPLGRSLDVVGIFTEMVEYNDGRLPTCLA